MPDNAKMVLFVPLHTLALTCSAVIQHGGFGTVNTVALRGVPRIPLAEQHDTPIPARELVVSAPGSAATTTCAHHTGGTRPTARTDSLGR
ncbi:nucleotide disphospho-sugar-binding domain-containing protein [Saccharothrix coeruleofusca]|uniref:Erythromycin biosynthesis protein CIII-like C-terminal domain-containing protein n=1 Tax=Saccharothrix coeruleofusca TaxID=33919 RepID=A0A918AP74_9PSEU|nr:nucleotide disphospho-sugar-binding domain-containing protein [Saccharothrix coeruleofusca]MBP2337493.1 UDP:flavonoid glycosyltransferase YjiC (YdhE family) [Saccharothrix coeruleofusca]GGP65392.1 hypothetical protein GCM10010185_42730 [Saccharothrix coeruleofusca]